jgi:hypothetical protein
MHNDHILHQTNFPVSVKKVNDNGTHYRLPFFGVFTIAETFLMALTIRWRD